MEQATHSSASAGTRELEAQLRECFGRVAYTHKTHEKQSDLCARAARDLKWWQVVLSAVTTGGLLGVLVADEGTLKVITAAASAVLLAVSTYAKESRQSELSVQHRTTAAELWIIRERYVSLIGDLRAGAIGVERARGLRDEYMEQSARVYSSAPRTTAAAYKAAGLALKRDGELTFADAEIDAFLPAPLRWGR